MMEVKRRVEWEISAFSAQCEKTRNLLSLENIFREIDSHKNFVKTMALSAQIFTNVGPSGHHPRNLSTTLTASRENDDTTAQIFTEIS